MVFQGRDSLTALTSTSDTGSKGGGGAPKNTRILGLSDMLMFAAEARVPGFHCSGAAVVCVVKREIKKRGERNLIKYYVCIKFISMVCLIG